MDPENGYFLRLLRTLLLPSGIVVQTEYEKYRIPYTIGFVGFISSGVCGIIRIFTTELTKIQKLETLFALNIALNILEMFAIEQKLRKKLMEIYFEIRDHYVNDDLFAELADKYSIDSVNKYKWILLWIYICTQAPPLIIIFTSDIDVGDLRALNFPSWYPWTIDTNWKYLITIAIQTLCTALANAIMYAGIGIIFCCLVAIRSHYEILKTDLNDCFQSTDSFRVKRRFIEVIKKHHNLMRFTKKLVDISSYLAVLITVMFIGTIIMLTSVILQAPRDYLFNLKLICSTTTLTTIFFWCCYVGEVLCNLTEKIRHAIFESRWHVQEVEIQKMVLFFMAQNQTQFKLKIFNLYWIKLNFFITVLRTCFSAIQILIA